MRSPKFIILVGMFLLAISKGCRNSPDPKLIGPVNYYTFSNGKKVGGDFRVDVGSDNYKSLQSWINGQKAWKRDWNTYAPQEVAETETVRINYLGKTVVLSVRKDKTANWSQFSCKSNEELVKLFDKIRVSRDSSS